VGRRDGVPITIASHGVGAAGANVCFAELLQGGVRTFIRAGTCGAICEGLRGGDLIVATGAVREDGVSDHWVPAGYPAIADRRLTGILMNLVESSGVAAREGLVVTEANFYPGPEPPRWQRYRDLGPLAVEMEMSSLFVMCSLNGARSGGILTVDGNLVETRRPDMSDYDPHRAEVRTGIGRMLEIAVEAAARASVPGSG
jgi:uridine phosphorylase